MPRIEIGNCAGHHWHGQADLLVVRHATCGNRRGYRMTRTRLVGRAAFEYDPRLGWETDVWFEWIGEESDGTKSTEAADA
jgi:hypothetical protein